MRITQRAVALTSLQGLNRNLSAVGKLQEQLTSGRQINKPADSPTGTNRAMQTRNDQADAALAQARAVVEEFIRKGPTQAELAAAQRGLIGGFPLRIDSNRKLLEQASVIGFYRLPLDWLNRFNANIQAVTLEGVRTAFAKRIRPEGLTTVVAGAAK